MGGTPPRDTYHQRAERAETVMVWNRKERWYGSSSVCAQYCADANPNHIFENQPTPITFPITLFDGRCGPITLVFCCWPSVLCWLVFVADADVADADATVAAATDAAVADERTLLLWKKKGCWWRRRLMNTTNEGFCP